jgi:hypothetical protein
MMNAHRSSPLQSTKKEGKKKREKNSRKAKLLRFHLLSISGATMCGRKKARIGKHGQKQTNKQTNRKENHVVFFGRCKFLPKTKTR